MSTTDSPSASFVKNLCGWVSGRCQDLGTGQEHRQDIEKNQKYDFKVSSKGPAFKLFLCVWNLHNDFLDQSTWQYDTPNQKRTMGS